MVPRGTSCVHSTFPSSTRTVAHGICEELRLRALVEGLHGFRGHDGVPLDTFCDVLRLSAPLRLPISGIRLFKGLGDVLAGRVERMVQPGKEVVALPAHTASSMACAVELFFSVWIR